MQRNFYFILIVSFCWIIEARGQLIGNPETFRHMKSSLEKQKELATGRSKQLFAVLDKPMKPEERQALEYLLAYLPLSDLADYSGELFLSQVRKTIQARKEMPWGNSIPEDIFLHFVLPVRVNNENLDNFRVEVYDELKSRIHGLSMKEAALEINHWCHEKVTYRGSDERTSSPLATMKTSFGRCGEESTFTVAALRTVGIPARQVYTPRWAHSDDNHAWVEVWVNGKWHFVGACEPEADLNMGWFTGPAMRAMLVHTRAFGWYQGTERVIDRQEKFSELNLISNYAESKQVVVQVLDENDLPLPGVSIEYQLYNYAEFYPIAKGKTDEKGFDAIDAGLGDLIVWAHKDGNWNFNKITVEKTDTLILKLHSAKPQTLSLEFDLVPPVEKAPPLLQVTEEAKARNARLLLMEDSIRASYMQTFMDSSSAATFAARIGIDPVRTSSLITNSYGNWDQIIAFLEAADPKEQPWALNLLESISAKDLRDTRVEVLNDHLKNSVPYPTETTGDQASFFSLYILSGRVLNEMMRPWRGYLQQQFALEFQERARQDINTLVFWIKDNIRVDDSANLHSRAPLSPRGVFEMKIADTRSRDIFFVAVSRSLGIPARINPATYKPQYWKDNQWITIHFEPTKGDISEKGAIHFLNGNKEMDPKYAIHFTIARYQQGVFRTIDLEFGKELSRFPAKVEVDAGSYYLVTGNRQGDGSVLSGIRFFIVTPGITTDVTVNVRKSFAKQEPWAKIDLNGYLLENYETQEKTKASNPTATKGAIFVWIDPDKEPTKHVMSDIPAVKTLLEKWNGGIVFLLNKPTVSKSFNPASYTGLPKKSLFCYDESNHFLNTISSLKNQDLSGSLPVVIISDPQGNLVYFSKGYKIGIGEQLAKEVSRMESQGN